MHLLLLLLCAEPQVLTRPQYITIETEEVIKATLDFLVEQQATNGGWTNDQETGSFNAARRHMSGTASVLLGFAAQGSTCCRGKYRTTVRRAVQFLLERQDKTGVFNDGQEGNRPVYAHCLTMLVLSELSGMMNSEYEEQKLRESLERAIKILVACQLDIGSWATRLILRI